MASLRGLRQLVWVLPFLGIAGCSSVGDGDKIQYLELVTESPTITPIVTSLYAYGCLRQQLGAIAVFNNGRADYTKRPATQWTSSNPDVVQVSNGDQIDPDNPTRIFPKGVITPIHAGTSIISANYVGVIASIPVVVQDPQKIIISTSAYDSSLDASASTTNIATGTTQQYYAYATLTDENNVTYIKDVSTIPVWSVNTDPTGATAKITTGALVTGVGPGGPVTVNANFSACPGTIYENIGAPLVVSNVSSLSIQNDPAFDPSVPLVIGTSEGFVVTATLANGATEDFSQIASLFTPTSATPETTQYVTIAGNVGTAVAVGTTTIQASWGSQPTQIVSPPLTISTQGGTAVTLNIAPGDMNQSIPVQGYYNHFHAVATFASTFGTPNFTQDVTRNVLWGSGNATDVFISNVANRATNIGLAVSLQYTPSCVNIGAVLNSNSNLTATTKLGVGVPVTPGTCP